MVTQTCNGKVLFEFYRPNVKQMAIAGDFNGWQHTHPMSRSHDGWWRSQIELAPGTYRFRYMGDGNWFTDYAAFGVEPGPFGWNSVLIVDPMDEQRMLESSTSQNLPIAAQSGPREPQQPSRQHQPETPKPERRPRRRRPVLVGRS